MRRFYALSLLMMLAAGHAHAATLPACAVSQNISAQQPYGTASLHKLFFHVYDATLWVDDAQKKQFNWQDANAHFALNLTYHVDIDAEDFLERTLEELDRQPDVTAAMKAEFKKQLTPLYPDVLDGDSITAVRDSKEGLILCHQGKVRGAITDAAMVRAFFAIWLGEHSSEPELRDTLLGYSSQ
jgi:Chalcone isomerase-like